MSKGVSTDTHTFYSCPTPQAIKNLIKPTNGQWFTMTRDKYVPLAFRNRLCGVSVPPNIFMEDSPRMDAKTYFSSLLAFPLHRDVGIIWIRMHILKRQCTKLIG